VGGGLPSLEGGVVQKKGKKNAQRGKKGKLAEGGEKFLANGQG